MLSQSSLPVSFLLLGYVLIASGAAVAGADDAGYVGAKVCTACHAEAGEQWRGSHHDLAMAEATTRTVLGDFDNAEITEHGVTSRFYRKDDGFFVHTDGPGGRLQDYRIAYTFGWYPLQQYLIAFPGGRLQSLGLAWDTRPVDEGGQRWFHLYPNEDMDHEHPLHWTARDQNWNYQCAECHSTDLKKGYDAETDTYETTWQEINVACEACHGPGSRHKGWADAGASGEIPDKGLVVDLSEHAVTWVIDEQTGKPRRSQQRQDHAQTAVCARCHSRRGQIWEGYRHGAPLHDTHRLATIDSELYFPDGQIKDEVYVYGSFLQSKMYAAGVTCSDCHEPHSLALRGDGNTVCARCHQPQTYDSPAHHHHEPDSTGAACKACHMPERVYMVNDWRADHSLRIPRPDLSESLATPDACTACHFDKPPSWAAQAVETWFPDPGNRGPHFGEILHAADTGAPDAAGRLLALAADPMRPGIARASALDRLEGQLQPDYLFTVRRLLGDQDAMVRAASVRLLEGTDVRTQVDLGWPLLEDDSRSVRLEAARVLAPLLRQGVPDRYRRQLQAAVDEYREAQQVSADRAEVRMNLGLIEAATGDSRAAEAAYRAAVRLEPGFVPAYVNLADLYRQVGADERGEAVLRDGIRVAPEAAALRHALGLLLVRQKQLPEALPELKRAAELDPGAARYGLVYALGLQGLGRLDEAVEVLSDVAERHPADRDVRAALDTVQRERGEDPAASGRVGG